MPSFKMSCKGGLVDSEYSETFEVLGEVWAVHRQEDTWAVSHLETGFGVNRKEKHMTPNAAILDARIRIGVAGETRVRSQIERAGRIKRALMDPAVVVDRVKALEELVDELEKALDFAAQLLDPKAFDGVRAKIKEVRSNA